MLRRWRPRSRFAVLMLVLILAGCRQVERPGSLVSPTAAGLNPNHLIDPPAQADGDSVGNTAELYRLAERVRDKDRQPWTGPRKSILALSGGGAYGAYAAGVICGWTCAGNRPTFDVVTGISTGSLIAPLVFLGPKYDDEIRRFYTTLDADDIYQLQILNGLFSDSLASNAPLARQVDSGLTEQVVREIAVEHRKGRRLYIGTTERDSKRLVVWDIGAIACRGQSDDRELIKKILLGSAAIPGFFPPSKIPVTVDGQSFVERHVDGSTSTTVFFRPPVDPADPECRRDPTAILAGTDLYVIIAGKLYADPEAVKDRAVFIAMNSVATTAYAQTRGDLQRIYFVATLTGMNYFQASIPEEFPAPLTNTDFDRDKMTKMFNEGKRQVQMGTVWRRSPPGVEPGETPLERGGTVLQKVPDRRTPGRNGCPVICDR